jgi:protein NrfD
MSPQEITTTRHNPHVDPILTIWEWEIPVYLFVGGLIAGMMILAGVNMLRLAKGERAENFYSVQSPILGFLLLNLGMFALFLDLEHKFNVYRVYMTFEYLSPMSWGSWILLLVYPVLIISALIRLPQAWPWLGERIPVIKRWSEVLTTRAGLIRILGTANVVIGVGLGIYTGILLSTMVARPLLNSAILGPLFLVSGLSTAAAVVHLFSSITPKDPAPSGFLGGAIRALVQPLGAEPPGPDTEDALVRADQVFLVIELFLISLLFVGLLSGSASQIASVDILMSGKYAVVFWGGVITVGIATPLVLQALELTHRLRHTIIPAILVLAGGFALRWVMVGAGQASRMVAAGGM